jgi:hypothetical protein
MINLLTGNSIDFAHPEGYSKSKKRPIHQSSRSNGYGKQNEGWGENQ